MRLDVVTIFPDYLAPLSLSLPGKAQARGLLEVHVHDLRSWTHDRHRTVDDTPYGGGAGMVMKPEPWGEALDALLPDDGGAVLVVPTPSGVLFSQRLAAELAQEQHLVFACGRYEGIDQRVVDHAATRVRVVEVSVGDYVLNGGEVAALAVIEAVVRLLPGFMGNAGSLVEESHGEGGLLEYPVYTKPATWRGLSVPEVLTSGDHARVEQWRLDQSRRRTAERRPDLLHRSRTVDAAGVAEAEWRVATRADAGELLTLQRACWLQEALVNEMWEVPALHEDLAQVEADLERWTTYVLRAGGRLVGSVRGRLDGEEWAIGRLMVAPDLQGRGLGRWLLEQVVASAPGEATRMGLVTGARSEANLRMYHRAGFRPSREQPDDPRIRHLFRRRR
ncbi:MAG TPA: tRNA (guanosine(37)-N1)-methyltransferase TrmD [Marmoricola sp.]|nr:tRNA (guanosine(37)-N1)-methyltransferase TrmD [Marmoricola sp.]